MFRNRKQPAFRIAQIVQLFEFFPGFAERRVRRLGGFFRVTGERPAVAEQFALRGIEILQIERLSFLQGKKNELFTALWDKTENARIYRTTAASA